MKITTVTIGKSVQVFQIGQPEYWHKVTMEAIVEENDTITDIVDKLFYEVDLAHEKYSQSVVAPDFVGAVKKETITDLKKEFNVGVK